VIIPTFNSSKTIDLVIRSAMSQTYPNIEVIVVDNNSVDETKKIAEKYKEVKVFNKGPERSAQRNCGAEKAKGSHLVFLDSDIELSPKVIEECMDLVSKGYEIITFPEAIAGTGFWAKCRALEARCYLGDDSVEAPRFYSKRVFSEVGGFDENVTGVEDWDLRERIIRRGYRIGRIKAMTVHHEGKVTPMARMRRKYYYGKTVDKYVRKYKSSVMRQIPFFRSCYYKNLKMLIKDPLHAMGFIVLKTLETLATGIGIVRGKFESKK